MRKWITSSVLILVLLSSAGGVGAHQNEGSCPLSSLPNCCKKAQSTGNTSEVSMARLCCNLNCSEPGSGGSSSYANFVSPQGATALAVELPHQVITSSPAQFGYIQIAHLPESKPKYIQHLALLI